MARSINAAIDSKSSGFLEFKDDHIITSVIDFVLSRSHAQTHSVLSQFYEVLPLLYR